MSQGTIKEYDIEQRTGSLLLDDGTEIRIDPVSVQDSGLRYLRLGQRVKFDIVDQEGEQRARKLRILTID
jgi:2-phospho-L-lactate/phosphoenolpyruvate guanylyltransferase